MAEIVIETFCYLLGIGTQFYVGPALASNHTVGWVSYVCWTNIYIESHHSLANGYQLAVLCWATAGVESHLSSICLMPAFSHTADDFNWKSYVEPMLAFNLTVDKWLLVWGLMSSYCCPLPTMALNLTVGKYWIIMLCSATIGIESYCWQILVYSGMLGQHWH